MILVEIGRPLPVIESIFDISDVDPCRFRLMLPSSGRVSGKTHHAMPLLIDADWEDDASPDCDNKATPT